MKQYKPRDKITQKMTRDGAIAENQTTGEAERISKRTQDAEFQKSPEQQAQPRSEATRCSFPHFSLAPCAGSCPEAGHRHRRARHGAFGRSKDPQSQ